MCGTLVFRPEGIFGGIGMVRIGPLCSDKIVLKVPRCVTFYPVLAMKTGNGMQ